MGVTMKTAKDQKREAELISVFDERWPMVYSLLHKKGYRAATQQEQVLLQNRARHEFRKWIRSKALVE